MDKSKIIRLMQQNNDLILKNPYYYKLYRSMSVQEFNEEDLILFIKLICELTQENTETLIKYITKFGYLD